MKKRNQFTLCFILLALNIYAQDKIPINEGLTGTWYNPETGGQGILFDINDETHLFFGAWFTFDTDSSARNIGASEQHWYTIQGEFQSGDKTVAAPIFETSGGLFNNPASVEVQQLGTFTTFFKDCNNAHVSYLINKNDTELTGEFEMKRLIPDDYCQSIIDNLPQEKVTLSFIGNEGVYLSDDNDGIFIDAIGHFGSTWNDVPNNVLNSITTLESPYDKAKAVLITHIHGDHFTSSPIVTHINQSTNNPLLFVPPDGRSSFSSLNDTQAIQNIALQMFAAETRQVGDIQVTTILTRHFNNPFNGSPFNLDNYVYAVKMKGKTIVHFGDIDYATDNFQAVADAIDGTVDAIILPTFTTNLVNQTNANLVRQFFPDAKIIASHLRAGNQQDINTIQQIYPNAEIFNETLESIEL